MRTLFLYFLPPTSIPYQKRQEQNEIEQISKFYLHKNARFHQAIIKAKKMPDCNYVIIKDSLFWEVGRSYNFR